MSNKTLIPAFRASAGDWQYFLCMMKYAEVARSVGFAYELGGNQDLGTMIQRGITERTTEIRDYLLNNEHHFLGSLVVAAFGGHAEYVPVEMADAEGLLSGVDREFGVLTFDGSHQFFALDGQHRLRAIKDAIKKDPHLGDDDIGVIVVPHFDDVKGRQRTRRLFSNINRNAKATSAQENIALDEDDGYAIITRRLLDEHPFFSVPGRVAVIKKVGESGELTLASANITANSPAWTSIGVLYNVLRSLGFDLDPSMENKAKRPSDEVLDAAYIALADRLVALLDACGDLKRTIESGKSARDIRGPKGRESSGHPLMRPVVQTQVARAARHLVEQELLTWDDYLKGMKSLTWELSSAPFSTVWIEGGGDVKPKMASGKGFNELLFKLLLVHLAPQFKAEIKRATSEYRALKGRKYPVAEEDLTALLPTA
ncbi:DNA sulfur modification protein DndB [Iamia majanohamensis]|uniref:DNA sulfur modification protein DndB n=1 Tax=Iamia majanohamensis TaxID=467976 RepID=A0AAE9Y867_9ACTN|nr:DNA sulfur modification protein DndB [Iamia majanohamensis]WCO66238.1 DNA sulfur modification protein DndB [Iamia majanohamensis]